MISLIIPTRNEALVIKKTIDQFQNMTLPHEVIITDGGSSNKTITIAREAGARVAEWNGPGRQTIAAGRNAGARIASGEFIAFMDADCFIDNPDAFFTTLLQEFKRDPKLGVATVNIRVDPAVATVSDKLVWWYMNTYNRFLNNVLGTGGGCEFYMFPKTLFEKIGGFREDLVAAEDYDMFSRMAAVAHVRSVASLTVFHTGRHARRTGWPLLLWTWFINMMSLKFRDKSYSKVWKEVR